MDINNNLLDINKKYPRLNLFNLPYSDEIINESNLDCGCGSKLSEVKSVINPYRYALYVLGPVPIVKTRAKRKVVLKKYWRKYKRVMYSVMLLAPLRNRPMYICNNCGRKMGFYEAIGTNLIKVEPLPNNSNIFYHE